jgi:hypothetical protein
VGAAHRTSRVKKEEEPAMSSVNGRYNVGGISLPRPFKVRRLGHFGFNALICA